MTGAHWYTKYIGRPYELNVYDCAHLVEEVLRNEFSFDITLPQHNTAPDVKAACSLIDKYKSETDFVEVTDPQEGDVILMRKMGLLHLGVYFDIIGVPHVLHNLANVGVIAEKIRRVNVIGFYRCLPNIQQTR